MTPILLHDWTGRTKEDVLEDFGMPPETLDGAELLVASYSYEDHSGCAFVLFRRDGKLLEVNGSHCSCYCLGEMDYGDTNSQWQPEETTADALLHREHSFDEGVKGAIIEAISA